jgi:hypothetical protein
MSDLLINMRRIIDKERLISARCLGIAPNAASGLARGHSPVYFRWSATKPNGSEQL